MTLKEFKFSGCKSLRESSYNSDKSGQTPIAPRYMIAYKNQSTNIIHMITDTDLRKKKRNQIIVEFQNLYTYLYQSKKVSIFGVVVNNHHYPTSSKFINTFKKKLKRFKNKIVLGYVWVRDIGDIKFEKHFHVIIATSFISKADFHELFSSKRQSNYNLEYLQTKNGLFNYLKKKELFGMRKQRSYGKSNKFEIGS